MLLRNVDSYKIYTECIPENGIPHSHRRDNFQFRMETDPVSETCFLVFTILEDGRNPETRNF
jgi:hypothetical protein